MHGLELSIACCCVLASDDGQLYYSIFFTNDNAFEEFYCICIQLVNKTWKEMKATSIDFTKVTHMISFSPDVLCFLFQVPGSRRSRAFVASPGRLRPQCGSISHPL